MKMFPSNSSVEYWDQDMKEKTPKGHNLDFVKDGNNINDLQIKLSGDKASLSQ